MEHDKTRARDGRRLSLLGGTVLFGYLGCQSPGPGSAGPVTAADRDSTSRDTLNLVARPHPVPVAGPLVVREGPTLGEPCAEPDHGACTKEGMLLRCESGIRVETQPMVLRAWKCVPGDTLVHYVHIGFTGLDKAGERRTPDLVLRRTPA